MSPALEPQRLFYLTKCSATTHRMLPSRGILVAPSTPLPPYLSYDRSRHPKISPESLRPRRGGSDFVCVETTLDLRNPASLAIRPYCGSMLHPSNLISSLPHVIFHLPHHPGPAECAKRLNKNTDVIIKITSNGNTPVHIYIYIYTYV